MSNSITDTENLRILIGGGIISIFLLVGLLTMLSGFICSIFGKKTVGSKFIWFGALCGTIVFSSGLVIAAWIERSWVPLVMLAAALLIPMGLRKRRRQKDERKQ
jgi:CHASE2 domain-containing sensor protein